MAEPAPPRIAVSGGSGFLGWHLRCAARARWGGDLVLLDREDFDDSARLAAKLEGVDSVVHLAGVNRSAGPSEVESVNPWLAEQLVTALRRVGSNASIVYGNSIHARGDSPFGHAKREAGRILGEWGVSGSRPVSDVHIPNVFGEHGRPRYNSFVATFCHEIAAGRMPDVVDDKAVPLIHAQRVAATLLDLTTAPRDGVVDIAADSWLVSGIREQLLRMGEDYRSGTLPRLDDPFVRDLFNTYRSATFPEQWPVHPPVNSDPRGRLSEAVKAGGGQTQVFYSLTNPGFTRGQHFHLGKVERFLVLRGTGEIRLRRLFTDEVVTFAVDGDTPAMVDMPTMWVHSITNTGNDDLITLFYADEIFDPCAPDTYPEEV